MLNSCSVKHVPACVLSVPCSFHEARRLSLLAIVAASGLRIRAKAHVPGTRAYTSLDRHGTWPVATYLMASGVRSNSHRPYRTSRQQQ
jgi:hypothetical protein